MARAKKQDTTPAICGTCMGSIDTAAVDAALRGKYEYVHPCGRVLVKAKL